VFNVCAFPLNEVSGQLAPVLFLRRASKVLWQVIEIRIEQRQERTERGVLATMRRSRHQNHVLVWLGGQFLDKPVPLMTDTTALLAPGAGEGFIDDDQFRAGPEELITAVIRFDVIQGNDGERIPLEQGFPRPTMSLQAPRGRRQDQHGLNVEFLPQFSLPLLGKVGWAKNCETLNLTSVQQLPSRMSEASTRSCDAHVVRHQDTNQDQA
jgi:hypothetical protein